MICFDKLDKMFSVCSPRRTPPLQQASPRKRNADLWYLPTQESELLRSHSSSITWRICSMGSVAWSTPCRYSILSRDSSPDITAARLPRTSHTARTHASI